MKDKRKIKVIKKLYQFFNLGDELAENCTDDEFVQRVFKGLTNAVHLVDSGTMITREVFGLDWKQILDLIDFCKKHGFKFDLDGSKNYQEFWIQIEDNEEMLNATSLIKLDGKFYFTKDKKKE